MSGHEVIEAAAVTCDVVAFDWPYARHEAEAIEANWLRRVARTPEIWNGRVLLMRDGTLQAGSARPVFHGRCFETDFKTFLGWRDAGFPSAGVRNVFSMAALESQDGAFILGEMAPHTAPAGQVYFPSGTPDPKDVSQGRVDLEASARRELGEETGLDPAELTWIDGMTLVTSPIRLCCMKRVVSRLPADVLVAQIHSWLATDPQPELARMHVVRGPADITPAMPAFVVAYLNHRFAATDPAAASQWDRVRYP
ncbi:NUDIX domain-containing protein [Lichenihabitans sp. Uapishka_5]|uniref:NUDIX domain-containing protein n=1 Tax=Lichenihabitans sp. Uapishka_5 TaxID=3037302 RepID=UPI0029E7EB1A|nr:NUDIX domain-containing protein [Lichenihabitans sp. Uapishka_5]MDX7951081.1 NUDIX domain-containing protein [Lichenihabitans sp. Uapishka_5]